MFDLTRLDPLMLEPLARSGGVNLEDHFVEIYRDDAALVESVRTFISVGINAGQAGIIIATPTHRAAIENALARDVDVPEARRRGLLTSVDAGEMLARIVYDGAIDHARFDEVVGDLLARGRDDGRAVRIFGEMVAVLWMEGDVAAAMDLEDGWNRLARSNAFRLFCAYPVRAFDERDVSSITGVCNRHSHVVVGA